VSGGTEGLFFRGAVDEGTVLDPHLASLSGTSDYPFRYGYCLCGVVEAAGAPEDESWIGRRVFAFEPHCGRFVASKSALQLIPDAVSDRRAVFFPLVETAATLILDAAPQWNDRVAVWGLGPLGALTAGLLDRFPLSSLVVRDSVAAREQRVLRWLNRPLDADSRGGDFDLAFDLGGTPASAAAAVRCLGFGGRLVLGSWQGRDLVLPGVGPEFHRKRLEIITSQVSTLAPALSGRWSRERRTEAVWAALQGWDVDALISHELPHSRAQEAFEALQADKSSVYQVVLTYG
jgi:threonine dehydrogenase-like Zn-dependent dehydrogenase